VSAPPSPLPAPPPPPPAALWFLRILRAFIRRELAALGGYRAAFFTRLAGALSPDPVPLGPAGSVLGDAVVAVAAAGAAAAGRWPALAVSGWELAAAVTAGSLLSPSVAFPGFRGFRGALAPYALA